MWVVIVAKNALFDTASVAVGHTHLALERDEMKSVHFSFSQFVADLSGGDWRRGLG